MKRIEIDYKTGERTVIQFTAEEEQKRLNDKTKLDKDKADRKLIEDKEDLISADMRSRSIQRLITSGDLPENYK